MVLVSLPRRPAALALGLILCLAPSGRAEPAQPALSPPPLHPDPAAAACLPSYLPRYKLDIDIDVAGHVAHIRQEATWINPHRSPTQQLVFNAHSRYVVPSDQIGFMAKMLEILRVQAGEALGYSDPPLEIHQITLVTPAGPMPLKFSYEGDTKTSLVVCLPRPVAQGESVTVILDETMNLPQKQGRWGQWEGVTFLSNWLPVFAFYGDVVPYGPLGEEVQAQAPRVVRASSETDELHNGVPVIPGSGCWQPTPFVPWHQPFFNESGIYHACVTVPCDQNLACSGTVVGMEKLPDGRHRFTIDAIAVREFTLLCSARYRFFEGVAPAGPGGAPVRVHVAAFPEHSFYARKVLQTAIDALTAYCHQLGPYPWADFTIAEAYFGWNGNECSTLVMIDQRVFGMPHIGEGYVEYLISHETCHQWWYNLVGTNGFCETWMDEAMANYFSHRLLNEKRGKNNAIITYPPGLEWLPNIRREDYRSYGMYGTIARGECTPIIQDMQKFGHLANLFNLCYDKGSRVVGMIEERLGEAAFFDFMRRIIAKYRYRIIRVADFQRELQEYTGASRGNEHFAWGEFFKNWLYEIGMSDWAIAKVKVSGPPKCLTDRLRCGLYKALGKPPAVEESPGAATRVEVIVEQRADFNEQTTLGIALPGQDGYPIRIPILPYGGDYRLDDMHWSVMSLSPYKKGGARLKVVVLLPETPSQIAIDPDQVVADRDPSNNYWHTPVRVRFSPLYTFLDETDLTCAYDRWNVIFGPWAYGPSYNDPWFTRSTMAGFRAGIYRTQEFTGGIYTAYRTDYRDVIAGVDALWDHFPTCNTQVGFVAEHRLLESNNGDATASRAALFLRYILTYGSSLYLPPFQYIDVFAHYSDNFLPFVTTQEPGGVRYDQTSTLGLHYKINYLTPYWDAEGGFQFEAAYEGGLAQLPSTVGVHLLSGQLSFVKSPPDLGKYCENLPWMKKALEWFSDTRFAFRAYGATSLPSKGEFFTMGSDTLFRGFDMAQRQGNSVWIGSVEWRVPIAQRMNLDLLDHVIGVRNAYLAMFYDVGDTYVNGHQVSTVAHALGAGLRLDVAWFSFVERTTLRLDVAQAINAGTGVQVWVGINQPF
jgi:hypothetical protein